MKIAAIICTLNRPSVLHETVLSIVRQSVVPAQIVIASPDPRHVLAETLAVPGVEFVPAPVGASKQRNAALGRIAADIDMVAFLDDDIELSRTYFAEMARLFFEFPEVIVASGRMLHDGGRGARIEREEARRICAEYDQTSAVGNPVSFRTVDSGYGCNMVIRNQEAGAYRFDEGLPLYSWLEDRDFSYRCTRGKCPPVELNNSVAVHLGWRSGRVSGVRLGFSTVVNPVYLMRKAGTFSLAYIVVHYWLRCLVGNVLGILTRDQDYDRWGLLKGNLLGYWHLLSGKCDPEHILQMQ
jgi:glycosyltransferase involved in cell wall biosynthesis